MQALYHHSEDMCFQQVPQPGQMNVIQLKQWEYTTTLNKVEGALTLFSPIATVIFPTWVTLHELQENENSSTCG